MWLSGSSFRSSVSSTTYSSRRQKCKYNTQGDIKDCEKQSKTCTHKRKPLKKTVRKEGNAKRRKTESSGKSHTESLPNTQIVTEDRFNIGESLAKWNSTVAPWGGIYHHIDLGDIQLKNMCPVDGILSQLYIL